MRVVFAPGRVGIGGIVAPGVYDPYFVAGPTVVLVHVESVGLHVEVVVVTFLFAPVVCERNAPELISIQAKARTAKAMSTQCVKRR